MEKYEKVDSKTIILKYELRRGMKSLFNRFSMLL